MKVVILMLTNDRFDHSNGCEKAKKSANVRYMKHSLLLLIVSALQLGGFFTIYTWTLTGGRETGPSLRSVHKGRLVDSTWTDGQACGRDSLIQLCKAILGCLQLTVSAQSQSRISESQALSCRTALSRSVKCFPLGSLSCPWGRLTLSRWFRWCGRVWGDVRYDSSPSSTRTVGGITSIEGNNIGNLLV